MKHHPDCEAWLDGYPWECTCSLTAPRPAWSELEPVSEEAWREMVRAATEAPHTPVTGWSATQLPGGASRALAGRIWAGKGM